MLKLRTRTTYIDLRLLKTRDKEIVHVYLSTTNTHLAKENRFDGIGIFFNFNRGPRLGLVLGLDLGLGLRLGLDLVDGFAARLQHPHHEAYYCRCECQTRAHCSHHSRVRFVVQLADIVY